MRTDTSIINELQFKESDKWRETVEEITNQRIVKAQTYLKRFKNHQRHLNIGNFDKSVCGWNDTNDGTSIFNNVDFPLKLAPSVKSDNS